MLRNKIIPSKESNQFLRMTLDSRLNWEEHIKKLRAKAKRALNAIKMVVGKKRGGDYGCQVYNTVSAERLKKLDSIHRKGIRIYTGAFRTSPVESLHVETNDFLLELRRKKLGLRFLYKLKATPHTLRH